MVMHTCNPSTQVDETGGAPVLSRVRDNLKIPKQTKPNNR